MDGIMNKINEWGISKSIIIFIIALLALLLVLFLIEKLVLLALRKLDDSKVYNEDKLIKKLLKTKRKINTSYHDPKNGQMYYACEYWKWQENKFCSIDEACKNRPNLQVTQVISTDLKKSNNKPRRYKKQIRAYFLT